MELFYKEVNDWFSEIISTAPPELRGGFFVTYLDFLDLQTSLAGDTNAAIIIAMSVALVVIFLCTLNPTLTLVSVFCVSGIIFMSIGILTLMGWELNILESVAITLAIGLSVDFTLHYAVAFKIAFTKQSDGGMMQTPSSTSCSRAAVSSMSGPITMSALTTMIAGLCLLPTRVLAYIQVKK